MSFSEGLFASISELDSQDALIAVAFLFLSYLVCNTIYQLYFSPLAKFPGPKMAAATLWYEIYYDVFRWGRYYLKICEMHERYGESIARGYSDFGCTAHSSRPLALKPHASRLPQTQSHDRVQD